MSSLATPPPPTQCILKALSPEKQVSGGRRVLLATATATKKNQACPPAPKPRMCEPLTESLLPKELNVKENSSLNLVFLPEIPDTTDVVELGSALRRHQPRRPLMPMLHDEALSAVNHKRARTTTTTTTTTTVSAATFVRLNRRPRRRNDSSEDDDDDDDRHPPLPFF